MFAPIRALVWALCAGASACGTPGNRADYLPLPPKDADVRIVSWNIKAGRGSSLADVARRLSTMNADVVTLQEVDRGVPRTGLVDQAAELGKQLGYESIFGKAIDFDGGEYGIATLSRFPIQSSRQLPLRNTSASEPRTALDVGVCVKDRCFHVLNHHADCIESAAEISVLEILDEVRPELGRGLVFAGDLNQQPSQRGPKGWVEDGSSDLVANFREAASFGNGRIDFILSDESITPCARRAGVLETPESDHNAVLADFDFASCD